MPWEAPLTSWRHHPWQEATACNGQPGVDIVLVHSRDEISSAIRDLEKVLDSIRAAVHAPLTRTPHGPVFSYRSKTRSLIPRTLLMTKTMNMTVIPRQTLLMKLLDQS